MTTALSCTRITKSLGGKPVLKALDLDVAPSEVVWLLWASGSGKTTLLRLIAGLMRPDAGRILLDGRGIWSPLWCPPERRRIGMVFRDCALWPSMTVEGNLAFGLRAQKLAAAEARARRDHALEVARPALMLFNEPVSNLAAALCEDLRTEMMDLVRHGGSPLPTSPTTWPRRWPCRTVSP